MGNAMRECIIIKIEVNVFDHQCMSISFLSWKDAVSAEYIALSLSLSLHTHTQTHRCWKVLR
jgi:hypothetical protein